jgi:surface protein
MKLMFYKCKSLKEINLNNFNTNNVIHMLGMFFGCSEEIKLKIRAHIKIINERAFEDWTYIIKEI